MNGLPCPNCGADLTFLEEYQRHFCYQCQQYAPEGYGARGPNICPSCRGILSYVAVYDRFFCYRCQLYAAVEASPEPAKKPEGRTVEAGSSQGAAVTTQEPHAAEVPAGTAADTDQTDEGEEELVVVERPVLTRELIETAKKSVLLDICKEYDLDPSGTKEQLKERLLSLLEEQESAEAEEEVIAEEEIREETESAEAAETLGEAAGFQEQVAPEPEPTPAWEPEPRPAPLPMPVEGIREVPAVPAIGVAPTLTTAVENPCPTCGRELDYIAQYDRWYCHFCRSYAPRRMARHACPTCGTTLRWIDLYGRWWCDTEQMYASADLPGPETAAASAAAMAPAAAFAPAVQAVTRPVAIVHRHRSPGSGIGIAAFGLFLWFIYQILVEIPKVTAAPIGIAVSAEAAFLLQFFGFLFIGVGVLAGLSALRDRR